MGFLASVGIVILGVTTMFAVASADTQPALEPGLWRITLKSTTNGKPDPDQDSKECLGEELKDIAAYFAPQLEGVEAQCTRTRHPSNDPKILAYRMHCTGPGFTTNAETSVTVENPRRFRLNLRIDSRAEPESATVVAKGEGTWISACPG